MKQFNSNNSIFDRVLHFIKYHNAFVIGFLVVFLAGASVFAASPAARDAVTGKEVTKKGIDNTALLNTDFSDFEQNLKIESVKKSENKYYLTYTYNSLAVKERRWQKVKKQDKLEVHKRALGGVDLGIYAAEELSEVAQADLRRLKKVKEQQQEKGPTRVQETTEYNGLAGLALNTKTKELSGYEPVKDTTRKVARTDSGNNEPNNDNDNQDNGGDKNQNKTSDTDREPQQTIEMRDQSTGQLYCLWLEGGDWQKEAGSCDSAFAQVPTDDTADDTTDDTTTDASGQDDGDSSDEETTYYLDSDEDGYGTSASSTVAVDAPEGFVGNSDDCNDNDADINPEAEEICDDGIDNDCDGEVDEDDPECETSEPSVQLGQDSYTSEVGEKLTFTVETSNFENATLTYAWDFDDGTGEETEVNSIDYTYNATGTYTLAVEVTSANEVATDTASVSVVATSSDRQQDTEAPTITLEGENPLTWPVGDTYEEPGASATDDKDGEVKVEIDKSAVDTSATGTYEVIYTATDSSDNTVTKTREVKVEQGADQSTEECSADNLSACDTDTKCTDAGLHWYEETCHEEEKQVYYDLKVSTEGEGTITIDPDQDQYEEGTEVKISAAPDEAYEFEEWSDGSTGKELTLTMDEDKDISASFEKKEYTVTAQVGEGEGSVDPQEETVEYGDDLTLEAIPDDGYEFSEWSGDASGSDAKTTIENITTDKSVTADFAEIEEGEDEE